MRNNWLSNRDFQDHADFVTYCGHPWNSRINRLPHHIHWTARMST
jgi:hypothetical protein